MAKALASCTTEAERKAAVARELERIEAERESLSALQEHQSGQPSREQTKELLLKVLGGLVEEQKQGHLSSNDLQEAVRPDLPINSQAEKPSEGEVADDEIKVIRPANDPLPNGIEYEEMSLCGQCCELRGFWRPKGATHTPGSQFRLFYYTQECKCDEAVSNLNEEWPEFDFKRAIELCHCCGSEPILTGSKFSPWFCPECEEFVFELNRKYRRYVIPFGRHSFHGGVSIEGKALQDPAERALFASRISEVQSDIRRVEDFAMQVIRGNLRNLGFSQGGIVNLETYLVALQKSPFKKQDAFLRLCDLFGVEP